MAYEELFIEDLKRFPNGDDLVRHVKRFVDYPLVMNCEKEILTLFHGDYWLNNVMLKKMEDGQFSCYNIDWQLFSFGSPAWDIALLLVSSMNFEGDIFEKVVSMVRAMVGHMSSFCDEDDKVKEVVDAVSVSVTARKEILEALIYAVKWVICSWDCMRTLHQNAVTRYLVNSVSAMQCVISSELMSE